jgi:hypothetical protein
VLIVSRGAAAALAATVLLTPWAAACGPSEAAEARRAAGAAAPDPTPPPAATPPGATPTTPGPSGPSGPVTPRREPDTGAEPAGPTRPAGGSTPRGGTGNTGTGPRITSVGLTAPDPRDGTGRPVSALHQQGCGDPERINIHVDATDPGGRLNGMYYEYEVAAAVRLQGSSDFFEIGVIREDSESYKTVIGPIRAEPANAAGGTVTITVHVRNTAGREAPPRRITATLLPCR